MLTGMLAVRNLVDGEAHDLWSVNTDQEYHEEVRGAAPGAEAAASEAAAGLLEALDPIAMGASAATVCATLLFLATFLLVLRGGPVVGPTLGLLGQYLPGYRVTAAGSVIGLAYGATLGFTAGWAFACVRNVAPRVYLTLARRQGDLRALGRLLE